MKRLIAKVLNAILYIVLFAVALSLWGFIFYAGLAALATPF